MDSSWEELNQLYEEARQEIQEALQKADTKGRFTKATVSHDGGLLLYREEGIGKLLRFPHFTCGDPTAYEARRAADLLFIAGFGTDAKLKAYMALDRVTFIRHANGFVFVRGLGSDKAVVPAE